jgi:molecular chaperone HtpG
VVHYKAEGTSEFAALMFIPSIAPVNMLYRDFKYGPMLYVKRVRIMDHCEELLPQYLRFVQGIVDSSDLPLNVSREILQNNRQVDIIKNSLTKKIIETFEEMKENDYDNYLKIYKEFGRVLKEGIHFDFSRREMIADLLLFPTTRSEEGKFRTLKDYVEGLKEGQDEIYYIVGSSLADAANSPYLEAFRQKDFEVIFMTDDIDDFIFNGFAYKDKKFHSITRGDIALDKEKTGQIEETRKKYEKLIDLIKATLAEDVKDVRLSGRLTDTVCCLVADEGDLDPAMERLLKAMGQDVPQIKRILELNPTHPLFTAMNKAFEKDATSEELKEYVRLLYDQALVLEGSKPKDPAAFSKAIAKLMVENANRS